MRHTILYRDILCNVERAGTLSRHVELRSQPFGLIASQRLDGTV